MNNENNNNISKFLLISNLQRPFNTNSFFELISKYGKVNKYKFDYIKSYCYVEVIKINKLLV